MATLNGCTSGGVSVYAPPGGLTVCRLTRFSVMGIVALLTMRSWYLTSIGPSGEPTSPGPNVCSMSNSGAGIFACAPDGADEQAARTTAARTAKRFMAAILWHGQNIACVACK